VAYKVKISRSISLDSAGPDTSSCPKKVTFNLKACVFHHRNPTRSGAYRSRQTSGHYTSLRECAVGDDTVWVLFNDSQITKIQNIDVYLSKEENMTNISLLLYERVGGTKNVVTTDPPGRPGRKIDKRQYPLPGGGRCKWTRRSKKGRKSWSIPTGRE
jgi:hypothetical protein